MKKLLTSIVFLLLTPKVFAGGFVFEGQLQDSASVPIASGSATIVLTLYDPSETCILGEETHSIADLSLTNGFVSLIYGTGTPTANDSGNSITNVFRNDLGSITGVGTCPYTPAAADIRSMKVNITSSAIGPSEAMTQSILIEPTSQAFYAFNADKAAAVDVAGIGNAAGSYFNYMPNNTSCANGEVLKYNTVTPGWECGTDNDAAETDPTVLAFAKTVLPTCSAGQVLMANGTSLSCVTDATGAGSVTSVTATSPLVSSGGAAPDISLPMATAGQDGYLSMTDFTTFNNKFDLMSASGAAIGDVLQWSGSSWTPTALAGGGTVTDVTGGVGLVGGTITGSGTLAVDVGVSPNQIVQLDGTGKLPAVDGSQLINLPPIAMNSITTSEILDNSISDVDILNMGVDKIANGVGKFFNYMPNNAACLDGEIMVWDGTNARWDCSGASIPVFIDGGTGLTQLEVSSLGTSSTLTLSSSGGNYVDLSTQTTGEFFINQNGINSFTINNTGFIGIGTPTPTDLLTVGDATLSNLANFSSGSSSSIIKLENNTSFSEIGSVMGDLEFRTNAGSSTMVLKATGEVGIGTLTPTAKLEVIGGPTKLEQSPWQIVPAGSLLNAAAYPNADDLRFYKDSMGSVHIQGNITIQNNMCFYNLPAGFWPTRDLVFTVMQYVSTPSYTPKALIIQAADGCMRIESTMVTEIKLGEIIFSTMP